MLPFFPKPDDDNTPQGKMAYGCMVVVWWGFVLLILFGLSDFVRSADVPLSYQGTIVHVTDGDTLKVHVEGWPAPFDPVEVRLDGIDTPESRKVDAKCTKELKLGLIAKAWMKSKLPEGSKVTLVWSGVHEKFGRFLGTVIINGENINQTLVRLGHAVPYQGGKKGNWC